MTKLEIQLAAKSTLKMKAYFYSCRRRLSLKPNQMKLPSLTSLITHYTIYLLLAFVLLSTTCSLQAAQTGTWTPNGNNGSAAAAGVSVVFSGVSGSTATAGTMNTTAAFYSDPYGATISGAPDIVLTLLDGTQNQTITITFNKPVTNPAIHINRIGGYQGTVNSSIWTLSSFVATSSTVTFSKLAGNPQFEVKTNSFQRVIDGSAGTNAQCSAGDPASTACGSVLVTGTSITSLTFTVSWAGGSSLTTATGDALEFVITVPDTRVVYKVQSNYGTGTFSFAGINGMGNSVLNTANSNPLSSATFTLNDNTANATITETPAPGFAIISTSCIDQSSTAIVSSLSANTLTLPASSIVSVSNQTITCTFINAWPVVRVQKVTSGGIGGPFNFSQTNLVTTPASITTSTTATPTPSTAGANIVTTVGTAVTLTESPDPTFFISGTSCSDSNYAVTGNTGTFGNLASSTLTIPAAKIKAGADITCLFTNTFAVPNLSIVKTAAPAGPMLLGQSITYTYVITNTGNVPMTTVHVRDMHGSPATQVALGVGYITGETLTAIGSGGSSDTTPNDGNWSTLAPGASVTFTYVYTVTQADIDHG